MAQHSIAGAHEPAEVMRKTAVTVRALHDPAAIRALLAPHRAYAAYALGQLAPRLFRLVRCWYAESGHGEGLVMHSGGGLGEASFMLGDVEAVDAILCLHRGPRQSFATCRPEHLPVLERYFKVAQQQTMARMAVTAATFVPPPPVDGHVRVLRLRAADVRTVNRLYNTEGAPTFYSAAHIDSS